MTDYHHDYIAFERLVLCAPWMVANMLERAERVKARAEITAPYDATDPDGQHYRDDFHAEGLIGESLDGTTRAIGRVTNNNSASVFVEFGARNTPRHRTLGNALDAAL